MGSKNITLLACLFTFAISGLTFTSAAVFPKSSETLIKDSELALTGVVTSRKFKCINIFKGRFYYTVKIDISKTFKGKTPESKKISFVLWQKRYGMPSSQGQGWLPKKGDKVKVYLAQNKQAWRPLIPNGIQKAK